jgi:hypothetical protein
VGGARGVPQGAPPRRNGTCVTGQPLPAASVCSCFRPESTSPPAPSQTRLRMSDTCPMAAAGAGGGGLAAVPVSTPTRDEPQPTALLQPRPLQPQRLPSSKRRRLSCSLFSCGDPPNTSAAAEDQEEGGEENQEDQQQQQQQQQPEGHGNRIDIPAVLSKPTYADVAAALESIDIPVNTSRKNVKARYARPSAPPSHLPAMHSRPGVCADDCGHVCPPPPRQPQSAEQAVTGMCVGIVKAYAVGIVASKQTRARPNLCADNSKPPPCSHPLQSN